MLTLISLGQVLVENPRYGIDCHIVVCQAQLVLLGGRLVRSGMIYWSQCMEGLIVMGVVYVLLLILRDQPVVGSLGLTCSVAA